MLVIRHIRARLPSRNCQLSFALRVREYSPPQSPTALAAGFVDLDVNVPIQLSEYLHVKEPLEICVFALVGGEPLWLGSSSVSLRANVDMERSELTGLRGQQGYLMYSVTREGKLKAQRSLDRPLELSLKSVQKKQIASRGFIKYKNSSSSSGYSENQVSFETKSGSESPFRKNKNQPPDDATSQQYYKLLDEIYHQILQEQLSDQRVRNAISQSDIFLMRYKSRVGKNPQ